MVAKDLFHLGCSQALLRGPFSETLLPQQGGTILAYRHVEMDYSLWQFIKLNRQSTEAKPQPYTLLRIPEQSHTEHSL